MWNFIEQSKAPTQQPNEVERSESISDSQDVLDSYTNKDISAKRSNNHLLRRFFRY